MGQQSHSQQSSSAKPASADAKGGNEPCAKGSNAKECQQGSGQQASSQASSQQDKPSVGSRMLQSLGHVFQSNKSQSAQPDNLPDYAVSFGDKPAAQAASGSESRNTASAKGQPAGRPQQASARPQEHGAAAAGKAQASSDKKGQPSADNKKGAANSALSKAGDLAGKATDVVSKATDVVGKATDTVGKATDAVGRVMDKVGSDHPNATSATNRVVSRGVTPSRETGRELPSGLTGARAALAKSFPVRPQDLDDSRVLTAGRAVEVDRLGSVAPERLILARRASKGAMVESLSPEDFWGAVPVTYVAPPGQVGGPAPAVAPAAVAHPASGRIQAAGGPPAGPAPVVTYSLPINFHAYTDSSSEVGFQAVVMVLNGLRYQENEHRFVATIAVGLRNPDKPDDRSTLNSPLKLVIAANAADTVSPAGGIQISKLGEPVTVEISAAAPEAPFEVQARTLLDEGDKIEIPVEETPVIVRPGQTVIGGLGLAKTPLQIEVPGLTGGHHEISLTTDRGQIVPARVTLDAHGQATAVLRSEGTGIATLTAAGSPFRATTTTVRFSFPLGFIVATLAGALAGWIARKKARHLTPRSCATALASGTILGIAYAIGIHWLAWAPDAGVGEGLPFFVAAIGAYSGMKALLKNEEEGEEGEREEEGAAITALRDLTKAAEKRGPGATLAAKTLEYLAASAKLDATKGRRHSENHELGEHGENHEPGEHEHRERELDE